MILATDFFFYLISIFLLTTNNDFGRRKQHLLDILFNTSSKYLS